MSGIKNQQKRWDWRLVLLGISSYPEIVVDDVKVGEGPELGVEGEGLVLDEELDLPGVGLELVADPQANALHHDVDEVLQLEGPGREISNILQGRLSITFIGNGLLRGKNEFTHKGTKPHSVTSRAMNYSHGEDTKSGRVAKRR